MAGDRRDGINVQDKIRLLLKGPYRGHTLYLSTSRDHDENKISFLKDVKILYKYYENLMAKYI